MDRHVRGVAHVRFRGFRLGYVIEELIAMSQVQTAILCWQEEGMIAVLTQLMTHSMGAKVMGPWWMTAGLSERNCVGKKRSYDPGCVLVGQRQDSEVIIQRPITELK